MDANSLINLLQSIENKTYIPIYMNKFLFYYISDIKIFPKFVVLSVSLDYSKYYNIRQLALQLIKLDLDNYIVQVGVENEYYDIKSISKLALNYVCIDI